MKYYYMNQLKSKSEYIALVKYMIENSQYFSLVYATLEKQKRMKTSVRLVYESLRSHKVCRKITNKWPNTETWDNAQYRLVFYKCDLECLTVLSSVNDVFDWKYPEMPIDLCFYKDGYCWFATTCHEEDAVLYTDRAEIVKELKNLGIDFVLAGETNNIFLYDFK